MEQRVSLIAAFAVLTALFTCGCTGQRMWWKETSMAPTGVPSAPLSPQVKAESRSILQASATSTDSSSTAALSKSFAKFVGKGPRKMQATELTLLWRNHIDYLPDHTRNGQMGAGLAGQLFLYTPDMKFAEPEGKLVIALYDETPRPPGVAGNKPEGWEFDKDTLRQFITSDERFGKCYAIFLPWPTYRPDVKNIRIATRYEPENGYPLYAAETRIALDTLGAAGQPQVEWKHDVVPMTEPNAGGVPMNGMSANPGPGFGTPGATWPPSPPPGYGTLAPAPPGFGAVSRAPEGALSPVSGAASAWPPQSGGGGPGMGVPAGAPPIVTILGR